MTQRNRWEIVVVAGVCTLVGILGGKAAFGGSGAGTPEADPAAAQPKTTLPAATVKNLGIETAPATPTTFYRTMSVAAVVMDTPRTEQPVFAPIGGRIESIDVQLGTSVEPGRTVITLIRDPLPRPKLTFTADVLRPAQEALHESVLELRRSAEEVRIAATELERVEKFTGKVGGRELPIIPRQRAIDLRYQLSRSEKAHEQAHEELRTHGLTDSQITDIEKGGTVPDFNEGTWQRALARNGLWPHAAQKLADALPESLRALPWVTATIGELAASGLATDKLTSWVSRADVARHFLDIGVLLQRGHTLDDLKRLHSLRALEPIVRVAAPPMQPQGLWDVTAVTIKPGAKVEAGTPLMTLRDPRRLFLRTIPVGGEVASILKAAKEGHSITARALIRGSGPDMANLKISMVESSTDNEGTMAFVDVHNRVQSEIGRGNGEKSRTWDLRRGLRYILEIPIEKMERVYVLPATAVTDDGPNKIVFLQDGSDYKPVPIVIAWQDHEVVVIPLTKGVAIYPGDPIVQSGAFELGLALKGTDPADAHAGHQH